MKIDLHLHSSYSFDSTNEVEEILKMAKENNFSYLAICDHNVNIDHDLSCINDLIENGIDGFEAYSSYHNEKDISFYQQICDDNDLIYTCGSDYHGSTKPNIRLGDHHYDNDGSIIIEKLKRRINIWIEQ